MTDNPNVTINHKLAERSAIDRAVKAIDALIEEAGVLRKRVIDDNDLGADATQTLASLTREVVQQVAILTVYLDLAEWGTHPEELIRRLREGLRA